MLLIKIVAIWGKGCHRMGPMMDFSPVIKIVPQSKS